MFVHFLIDRNCDLCIFYFLFRNKKRLGNYWVFLPPFNRSSYGTPPSQNNEGDAMEESIKLI